MQWIRSLTTAVSGSARENADFGFTVEAKQQEGGQSTSKKGEIYGVTPLLTVTGSGNCSRLTHAVRNHDAKGFSGFISPPSANQGAAAAGGTAAGLSAEDCVLLAENNHRRLRTMRHPALLAFEGGVSTDRSGNVVSGGNIAAQQAQKEAYQKALAEGKGGTGGMPSLSGEKAVSVSVVTEKVAPLKQVLSSLLRDSPGSLPWGLYQVGRVISFLQSGGLVHGRVCVDSIYVNMSGDWKLGCLELVSKPGEASSLLRRFAGSCVPERLMAPELAKGNWDVIAQSPPHALDAWAYACLMWEVYNDRELTRMQELKDTSALPPDLMGVYKQLLSSNPQGRISVATALASEYFTLDPVVESCMFLEEIAVKDQFEKDKFFRELDMQLDQDIFTDQAVKNKILPQLIVALDLKGASSSVLTPLLKITRLLTTEEFAEMVSPSIPAWFANPDRALRTQLLQNLDALTPHFSEELVDTEIFPKVATGFLDTAPALRELTVKSMLVLVPKLTERTINTQLLKHFAKLQMDPEAGIRTNTTICLAKLAEHFSATTRDKVLIPAFSRALRDPHPKARIAGLMSFEAALPNFQIVDVATKVLPVLSPLSVDSDGNVREKAFGCIRACVSLLEDHAAAMPEQNAPEQIVVATATGGIGSAVVPEESSGGGWLSSITGKGAAGGAPGVASASGGTAVAANQSSTSAAPRQQDSRPAADRETSAPKSSMRLGASSDSSKPLKRSSGDQQGGWDDAQDSAANAWDDGGGDWEDAGGDDWNDAATGGGVGGGNWDAVLAEEGGLPTAEDDDGSGDGGGGDWDNDDAFADFNFDVAAARTGLTAMEKRAQRRRGGKGE